MSRNPAHSIPDRRRWPYAAATLAALALSAWLGRASGGTLYLLPLLTAVRLSVPAQVGTAAAAAVVLVIVELLAGPHLPRLTAALVMLILLAVILVRRHRPWREVRATVRALRDVKDALDQAAIVSETDLDGRILHVNDKFCEISGYRREELIGADYRLLNSELHPKEFMRELWETISRGRVWRGEIRNRAKDASHFWVDTTIVPLLDPDGKPRSFMAIHTDVTARRRAEEELRRQEALARLGQLSAVVAHEVKNPLAGIAGALQIIGERLPEASGDRRVVDNILQRIEALNLRLRDLLLYARPRTPRKTPIALRPFLERIVSLLRRDPAAAEVEARITGRDVTIPGDPQILQEALFNLLLNASQSMGGRGVIEVKLEPRADCLRITIADHGPGIPEGIRERVFEPFFSTKTQGTGLGLAIARQVVQAHGGAISLACPAGGGTRVVVDLPVGTTAQSGAFPPVH